MLIMACFFSVNLSTKLLPEGSPFIIHVICFSQPGKCLYTTVRELVENALDSAEAIAELPIIEITMYVSACACIS